MALLCETCGHKEVCKCKEDMAKITNKIDEVSEPFKDDPFHIKISCKHFNPGVQSR